jgi:hypothetical protein
MVGAAAVSAPVVRQVIAELSRGATTAGAAARLGISEDLVQAVVSELVAAGVVTAQRCDTGPGACPSAEASLPSCAGCPLAHHQRNHDSPSPARAVSA